jgi:hypothetical protein
MYRIWGYGDMGVTRVVGWVGPRVGATAGSWVDSPAADWVGLWVDVTVAYSVENLVE